MEIRKIIIIQILNAALIAPAIANYCSTQITTGPFHLEPNANIDIKIRQTYVTVSKVFAKSSEAHGVIAFRSYWKSYCFQGGPMDGNTGCIEGLHNVRPTIEEATRWIKRGKCTIGKDIIDAWGSDSAICNQQQSLDIDVDHKELSRRSTNNRFWYHICNISWRCGAQPVTFPISLETGEITIPTANGTLVKSIVGKFAEKGDEVLYITQTPSTERKSLNMSCIENIQEKTYYCTDPETRFHFEIAPLHMKCYKSACYSISSTDTPPPQKEFLKPDYWNSASIRDISNLVNYIHELEYTNQMNLVKLQNHIYTQEKMILAMVESMAKIDDRLIGHMLGEKMQTKFLSDKLFLISPCSAKSTNSNCIGNQIFKDGRWVLNNNPGDCIKLAKSQNMTLFDSFSLWLPTMDDVEFQGTARDLQGWSYFASVKESLDDTMRYTKQGGPHSSLQDIVGWPEGALNNIIHSYGLGIFGSYIFCFVLVIIAYFIIKRF